MNIKKQAHAKMLKEMNSEHTGAEDAIHNWLCEQDDERLLQGILEEGRTIKGAMQHCVSLARKRNDSARRNRITGNLNHVGIVTGF